MLVGIRCGAYDRPIDTPSTQRDPDVNQFHSPSRGGTPQMMEVQPTVVSLTDAAASKLRELTAEETNPDVGLRVYVYSGGCSGFRYGMMLEDAPTAEDKILEANGVKVYVDGSSVDLLKGSQIDYVDTLMGAGFTVNNPNAVAACGCGSSFRTADDSGTARACAH
jgi:iron-sulfur cluster assembly accessory protein